MCGGKYPPEEETTFTFVCSYVWGQGTVTVVTVYTRRRVTSLAVELCLLSLYPPFPRKVGYIESERTYSHYPSRYARRCLLSTHAPYSR
ncbi:hypothetical protein J6590_056658 [Homalodisca vitripennis]|nr:hypothetical protein J6590_056658 [Homalodisca vitripennis]